MQITPKNQELNPAEGSLIVEFEFTPANPIEHEILSELLTDKALEKAFAHTTHDGGLLRVKLIVSDNGVLARAQHNLENLRRKDAGLPSLEEEQAAKAAAEAAAKAAAEEEAKQPPVEPAPPAATLSSGYAAPAEPQPPAAVQDPVESASKPRNSGGKATRQSDK